MVGVPPILADGQISWDEFVGLPAILADGQIAWGEIMGVPAGFADGVDDGRFVSYVSTLNSGNILSYTLTVNLAASVDVDCQLLVLSGDARYVGPKRTTKAQAAQVPHEFKWTREAGTNATFQARCRSYSKGIAPAALKRQLKAAKVVTTRSRTRWTCSTAYSPPAGQASTTAS